MHTIFNKSLSMLLYVLFQIRDDFTNFFTITNRDAMRYAIPARNNAIMNVHFIHIINMQMTIHIWHESASGEEEREGIQRIVKHW